MFKFQKSTERWWQKPLVVVGGRILPAELAVLAELTQAGESGVWMNSRGTKSGVVDVRRSPEGKFKTLRSPLPAFVGRLLQSIYEAAGLRKGAPDLVIWSNDTKKIRFVEVKCPHWDKPSKEQLRFLIEADRRGIPTLIAEWEFVAESI